jgi:phage tail-like protein
MFKDGKAFSDFYIKEKIDNVVRQTVVITLLDEDNNATMKWTLKNVYFTKITGANIISDTTEGLVETMELAHEGLTIG